MAEQEVQETKPKTKSTALAGITLDELQQIIVAAVTAATAANASVVAQAVSEARKPVVDQAKLENDRQNRESVKQSREIQTESLRLSQESCPHRQGCNPLSSFQSQLSSWGIHVLDTGLPVAICTNCLKIVFADTDNPEERKIFREKSANQASRAGVRFFRNQEKAMTAGRLKNT
jgi:hypothetical protein